MDNDFDSVSWRNEPEDNPSSPPAAGPSDYTDRDFSGSNGKRRMSTPPPQAGRNADAVDLGGIGDGRLDCTVDTPQRESGGTKDAYVSYLVTTHVRINRAWSGSTIYSVLHYPPVNLCFSRRISSPFKNLSSRSVAASQTLSFSIKHSQTNTPNAPSPPSLTNTNLNTSAATASVPTSPPAAHTPSTASSNASPSILSFAAPFS